MKNNGRQFHVHFKVIMQEKLFQRCTHLLYCSVLSLDGNVNDVEALHEFHLSHKKSMTYYCHENYYVNYQNHQNLMLLTYRILNEH